MACISGLGFTYAIAYLSTCGFLPRGNKPPNRVEALQRLVVQNVKLGDSPDRVIQFLDGQHLEHSMLIKAEFEFMHIGVIGAIKHHTAGSFLWNENIELVFAFNDEHELTRFDLIPTYTSRKTQARVNSIEVLGVVLLCLAWLAVLLAVVLPIGASLFLSLGIEVPRFWTRSRKVFLALSYPWFSLFVSLGLLVVFGWATWRLATTEACEGLTTLTKVR